uniref:Kinetochore protein Sos7 coiled-coil domain-containing protein n=1 Tax=Mycena chlorophos TaxID=658473 RepID=A0ABQ0MD31_MYCCL|nr:predicted protein [Mycena chlorophos]
MSLDADSFQAAFQAADLDLPTKVEQFNAAEINAEKIDVKDPAVIVQDLAAQTSHLRKLKFRFLEQNAKAKYIRNIVTDIDDAAFVTEEDNQLLDAQAAEKKEQLREAKQTLAEGRQEYRELAPRVEAEYARLKDAAAKAQDLTQKIIDARLALTRLRQAHPKPHLTISGAEQRLTDQVTEMQELSDQISEAQKNVAGMKGGVKTRTQEVEKLRADRAEAEKAVKAAKVSADDDSLMPLYNQHVASLKLHKSVLDMPNAVQEKENALQLEYVIERRPISIQFAFHPNTRQLADVNVTGLDEQGVDVSEVLGKHTDANDVPGLVAGVLNIARAAAAS